MRIFKKVGAIALALLMVMNVAPIGLAQAKMVTTDQVLEHADPASDRERVESFILRDDVQKQLVLLGINSEEAASRVASLSNEEIQQIAGRLDELPAGEGGVGVIVGAILIIFLVLLITDLLGLTDVFPFVNKKAK
ncbi:MAG: PA2779 family protein [Chloroflexi bacterium]|nr:PA2779 family protein [Chloroflexota bacterium]